MRQSKGFIFSGFGVELTGGGGIWLPKILLQNYSKIGLSNQEMMLVLHLLCILSCENGPYPITRIAQDMDVPPGEILVLLQSLSTKGILLWDSSTEYIIDGKISLQTEVFLGLFDKLMEIWGCQQAQKFQQEKDLLNNKKLRNGATSKAVSNLYRCFEKEFGRPLSPMESTQIMEWYYGDKYSQELILEALKRAVLRGVINFKYVDSILRGWSKNNLRTVKAVIAYEEAFSERKNGKKKTGSQADADDLEEKYKDIYLT